jgi:hypothetical protein
MQRIVRDLICDLEIVAIRRRRHVFVGATLIAITLFAGYRAAHGQETMDSYKFGRDAQQGKKINPVSLNLTGKNPEIVYLGSYLVNGQGGCNSCHTCPSYKATDPYKVGGDNLDGTDSPGPVNAARFLAGGTPFSQRAQGKGIVSSNLTPNSAGLPNGMTFDDFKNAMQNGRVSSKPGHTLQIHPWPVYRKMYDNDLFAIYEYLSSLPATRPGVCSDSEETEN